MADDDSFTGTCPTCGQKYCGAEIRRLRAELTAARDALRNDFEPDNQSKAWHRANSALEQEERKL